MVWSQLLVKFKNKKLSITSYILLWMYLEQRKGAWVQLFPTFSIETNLQPYCTWKEGFIFLIWIGNSLIELILEKVWKRPWYLVYFKIIKMLQIFERGLKNCVINSSYSYQPRSLKILRKIALYWSCAPTIMEQFQKIYYFSYFKYFKAHNILALPIALETICTPSDSSLRSIYFSGHVHQFSWSRI